MRLSLAAFGVGCLFVVVAAADDRVKVPPAADIEASAKLVRSLFKDDYAKPGPKAKAALAEKLFKQADETRDDNAALFVLLRETAELAAAGGEADLAVRALDGLRAKFAGLAADQFEPLLKAVAAKAAAPEASLALTNYLLRVVDEAVAADDLDGAARVLKLADGTAARSKSLRTAAVVAARVKEVEGFKADAPAVAAAVATLAKKPDDPDANAAVGRYLCFQKGEWDKGLLHLAKGSDAPLRDAAKKETAGPATAADILAVADAWFLTAPAAGPTRRPLLARAQTYYAKASPDLSGLNRTKADKRLEELEKLIDGKSQYDDLWAAVRAAVRAKSQESLAPLGGFFTTKEYADQPADAAVLIGFNYTTRQHNNSHLVMGFLQPIYLTPKGEKLGAAYGKLAVGVKAQTVKAKPGYAVGSLMIKGGGLLEGFLITFMKIDGKGLKPADNYDSPWMGREEAGHRHAVVGDGRPVIGIHGKRNNEADAGICNIGLVVVGTKPTPAPKKN